MKRCVSMRMKQLLIRLMKRARAWSMNSTKHVFGLMKRCVEKKRACAFQLFFSLAFPRFVAWVPAFSKRKRKTCIINVDHLFLPLSFFLSLLYVHLLQSKNTKPTANPTHYHQPLPLEPTAIATTTHNLNPQSQTKTNLKPNHNLKTNHKPKIKSQT